MRMSRESKRKLAKALGMSVSDLERVKGKWNRHRKKCIEKGNLNTGEIKTMDTLFND